MEGVWFAYDAATGAPIYQRVKVIDNVEHPDLKPGKPVAVYPSSLGGLNYSPASFDPQTSYVYNAASETASVLVTADVGPGAAPGAARRRRLPRARERRLRPVPAERAGSDYGSVSAIDVATGKRVWKFKTPRARARRRRRRRPPGSASSAAATATCGRSTPRPARCSGRSRPGFQIAAGPVDLLGRRQGVHRDHGRRHGDLVERRHGRIQLQVFALGGSSTQSVGPKFGRRSSARQPPLDSSGRRSTPGHRLVSDELGAGDPSSRAGGRHRADRRIAVGPSLSIQPWDPNTSNTQDVEGHVLLGGHPVAGAQVRVDGWLVPALTDEQRDASPTPPTTRCPRGTSSRSSSADRRRGRRPQAQRGGAERRAGRAKAGISVGYRLEGLAARSGPEGTIVVTGQVGLRERAQAPPPVLLYSYQLRGTITDANGKPVKGAVVTTRTGDHKFWTQSRPTGAERQLRVVPRRRRHSRATTRFR